MLPMAGPTVRRLSQMIRVIPQRCHHQDIRKKIASFFNHREGFVTELATLGGEEDKPYPLTKEEALDFVKSQLGIPNPEADFKSDRLELLNNVIDQINKIVPFTNLHLFTSTPMWGFTEHMMKEHILSGVGGTCLWINSFTKAMLENLGYRCYHVCGNNPGDMSNDTHLSTIVCDVTYTGSHHLVDPGTRRPLCRAIPLDFKEESPTYKFHFMKSKFIRDGETIVWCAQTPRMSDRSIVYDSEGQRWQVQVTYWPNEKRNWYSFMTTWHKIYQSVSLRYQDLWPPFNGVVFFAYLNDKIVSIIGNSKQIVTIFWEEDSSYKKVFMNKNELITFLQKHFPQYSISTLREVCYHCELK